MRQAPDLFFPYLCEALIGGTYPAGPDYPADKLTFPVIDEHPVAPELPTDGRAGGINTAGKSLAIPVPAEERAGFFSLVPDPRITGIPVRDLAGIVSVRVDREQVTGQSVPAVIVPIAQLTLDLDKRAIPGAAFPATIADKFYHTVIVSLTASLIKKWATGTRYHTGIGSHAIVKGTCSLSR